ncbi:hypothetical protein ABNIH3_03527 [Acinetobacter baumannii ABNIH3]|nr:hypothetical protein ABNIH3_03527 [Acinetobacter baumannii ABNIH3]
MSIEDFFIKDSPSKRYLLMSLALFMLIMALIAYFKGKLGFEYVFSLIAGYALIFFILKKCSITTFPPTYGKK